MSAVIPSLDLTLKLPEDTRAFLVELRKAGFIGDIDATESARIVAATDNSIYQLVPQAILYPKGTQDVRCILRTANSERFQSIRFTARGGGTGTNGQSLTEGVVIDLSRHMNRVLEINPQEGWVRVEAGVVKDQLNQALAEHGYFFAPDTSTSNRCTIGGMIATDASGQGSLIYGKTSDHVLGLKSVLASGEVITTQPISVADAQRESEKDSTLGKIYRQALATCVGLRREVEQRFPPLNRFLTGYDLQHTYQPEHEIIDVSRLITGAEGTLALVTEAKLTITPTPKHKVLVNVKYLDFQDALRHAPELVKAQATSVETIDSNVLDLARKDVIWHEVSDLLTDVPPYRMDGINILEFTATDQSELGDKIKALITQLKGLDAHKSGVIGYQICREADSIQRIYAMRKKAVGLLGATAGRAKPVAFVEDTAVPPERLAEYILEFRALLDSYSLHYGMFGHVDAGVLHVRPALDMQDPASETLVREISDQVVALTAKYGGLMWGEHGKGFRSEYGPEFFGEQLFTELRKIKTAFDPRNRFNPGKICTPLGSERKGDALVSVDSRKRGWFDRQIPTASQQLLSGAMDCNGNGLCFNFDTSAPMCPSYRASKEKRFSPKGRASLLREWARRAGQQGFSLRTSIQEPGIWQNSRLPKANGEDFSDQVRESLDTCLACKACSTQCPVKVDIPRQRAVFYGHYHERYRRPLRDYLIRSSETSIGRLARFPRIANLLTQNAVASSLQKTLFAYVDTPKFSVPRLQKQLPKAVLSFTEFRQQAESQLDSEIAERYVFILQDTFTSSFNASVVAAFARMALALNIVPVLLPLQANGKPAHVKGFLQTFQRQAVAAAETLSELSRQYPTSIVGMDAATTLIYRDEYRHEDILGSHDFEVSTIDEWLDKVLQHRQHELSELRREGNDIATLLPHCTEQTALPQVRQRWQQIFESFGVALSSPAVGCCGMAGTFGHETEQQDLSAEIYQLSWKPTLASQHATVLASGFSCRCQVERHSGVKPLHPIEWLVEQLKV